MMTYGEIIRQNCNKTVPQWWPKYAYHFSDVTNIISILSSGQLYSRVQANRQGIMENDNASRQVISMTETEAQAYARFYFRPLTPTQYHNEGYKHARIRFSGDTNANVPVPVFLVFDLELLLSAPGTLFSPLSQAGHGSQTFEGIESFSQLPFDKIYSSGPCERDVWQYRHAEILYPNSYSINDSLRMILCRNECEKATLLTMLRDENQVAYYQYKDLIRVARDSTFERNGLFVESVVWDNKMVSFSFACTPQKRNYDKRATERLEKMKASFTFAWLSKKNSTLYSITMEVQIDYISPEPIAFTNIPEIAGAARLKITMKIEDKIICVCNQNLSPYEML